MVLLVEEVTVVDDDTDTDVDEDTDIDDDDDDDDEDIETFCRFCNFLGYYS